jgi:hypothetical protein
MILVALAAGFAAYAALRQGWVTIAGVVALLGVVAMTIQALHWTRSRNAPRRWLERTATGGLVLGRGDGPALPVHLQPATRLLGGSVFIDARCAITAGENRVRCWITPYDVPREHLRQWTIFLLAGERVANRDGSPVTVA